MFTNSSNYDFLHFMNRFTPFCNRQVQYFITHETQARIDANDAAAIDAARETINHSNERQAHQLYDPKRPSLTT